MADLIAARKAMVDHQIATSSVTEPRLLQALGRIPREQFVPTERVALAYSDAHHPLGKERFLAAPATFARLVQLAEITEDDRVLDYWPGTGYSTAILASLSGEVVAVEPDRALAEALRSNLAKMGIANVQEIVHDPSALNLKPFDAILLEGAVARVPDELLERLAPGGRLVCLIRQGPVGIATVYSRTSGGIVTRTWFNATLPQIELEPSPDTFVF